MTNHAATYFMRAHIGDMVYDVNEPRHIGRIERICWSRTADVRWRNGWLSQDVTLSDLRKANRRD